MTLIELEAIAGLEAFVVQELDERFSIPITRSDDGHLVFVWKRPLVDLTFLKTIIAAYIRLDFAVPRPKALLGHEHWTRLLRTVALVQDTSFKTLSISAAGSESSVMRRIRDEFQNATGLIPAEQGDLHLRIRRSSDGWTVLLRTTPRPLSVRDWRVRDFEGALNGPVAYAMNRCALGDSDNLHYVNVMSGSGTLLCELEEFTHRLRQITGCELEPDILSLSRDNLQQTTVHAELLQANARHLPYTANSIDAITSDMPFGQHVGSHQDNLALYPATLHEMHRVLKRGGRCVLLSHEIRLIERLLQEQKILWNIRETYRIDLRGLHPRLYVLEKR